MGFKLTKKMQKRMYREAVTVHLDDSLPTLKRFGTGLRPLWVEKIGNKWVHVRAPYNGEAGKVPVRDWERLTA